MKHLLKVDKNGTKYWMDDTCPKCGGSGYIDGYWMIEGGICFKCGGNGKGVQKWKEHTPEYAAKLEAKRVAKAKAKAPEINAKFFKSIGFNENGEAWVVVGVNTYEVKDALKEAGAKFTNEIGWHFDREPETFKGVKITINQVADENNVGTYFLKDYNAIKGLCDEIRAAHTENPSEHVGNVGEKVEKLVTLKRVNCFETHFGYYEQTVGIYVFEDENKNVLIWKTASAPNVEIDETVTIRGTVKELNEYKGTKQTVLTRCKIK